MTDRLVWLLIALFGLLLVAGLVILGIDLRRAAKTGPKWKRQLLGAALVLLGIAGLWQFGTSDEPAGGGGDGAGGAGGTATGSGGREDFPEWRRLVAVWAEAEAVASGGRGPNPFDRKGKQRLLEDLTAAAGDVDALAQAGKLDASEAGLLREDLKALTIGVGNKRPVEERSMACYRPMLVIPARESAERLAARLPFLEKLASSEKLHPAVVQKALVSVERDLAVLADEKSLTHFSAAERAKAEETGAAVRAAVEKGRARLAGDEPQARLEQSSDLRAVVGAWAYAKPLATSGKSTTAERRAADEKLAAAKAAIGRLVQTGELSSAEAELLKVEATNIREDIYRGPPTDRMVKCYISISTTPARRSLGRLAQRLPLIEKLAAGGKLNAAACEKIIAAVRADLGVLAHEELRAEMINKHGLSDVPRVDTAQARKVSEAAEAALARLRARLGAAAGRGD